MGRRNYLIEGVSGAGKTAVCTELQRRGYQAIHGDRELVYRGDPETGTPTATWMSEHQVGSLSIWGTPLNESKSQPSANLRLGLRRGFLDLLLDALHLR
jgi:predicted ATPase